MTRSVVPVLVAILSLTRAAAAEPITAERFYLEGQAAYDAADYTHAITAWTKSYELSKQPGLLFNLGHAYRLRAQPGDCKQAHASYQRFVAGDPASTHRKDADDLIVELDRCVNPTRATPAAVPATHVVPATHDAREPVPNGSRTKRTIGLVAGAGGALVFGTGLYYGNKASRISADITDTCTAGCNWDELQRKHEAGKRAEATQWVLYGAGAAAVVTGGVLYFLGSREHRSVAVTPTGNGASITWSGSW